MQHEEFTFGKYWRNLAFTTSNQGDAKVNRWRVTLEWFKHQFSSE
jgi:hypothetical protein